MRILVEVAQPGPEARHLLEQYGAVVGENREDRVYILEIHEPEVEKRRALAEEISESVGKLEGVRSVFIPGYRTLWPERWDKWN